MRSWMFIVLVLAPLGAAAQEAGEAAITRADIEDALARYDREPDVRDVVQAAMRVRAGDPARIRDAIDRARASGALPTARFAVRRGQAVDLSAFGGDAPRTNLSTDDDLTFEGSVVFRFERFAFAAEETSLLRELRALEESRAIVVRGVASLYFERRRLQLERDLLGTADLARELRILEIEALLDVFTDGAFTRMMGALPTEPSRPP
jgi:hypothetical protein